MRWSNEITEFAKAFCLAQSQFGSVQKSHINPHFKSRYADLASYLDVAIPALTANGISLIQSPRVDLATLEVTITSRLLHVSGQWFEDDLTMRFDKSNPQAIGSAITYARRYQVAPMLGLAPEDDDGNAASSNPQPLAAVRSSPPAALKPADPEPVTDLSVIFNVDSEQHMQYLLWFERTRVAPYCQTAKIDREALMTESIRQLENRPVGEIANIVREGIRNAKIPECRSDAAS